MRKFSKSCSFVRVKLGRTSLMFISALKRKGFTRKRGTGGERNKEREKVSKKKKKYTSRRLKV